MTTQNGTSGNDTITGSAGDDTIDGQAGNDTIRGGDGRDTVFGGAGYDQVSGEGGDDTLYGGDDGVYDDLYGGAGNDTLYGGNDDDNWLYGGTDNDTIYGGSGRDVASGDAGADEVHGGGGDDSVSGGTGNDTLYGGTGNDTVSGGDDNDSIFGGDGADTVYGGFGDDYIDGGSGNDRIQGEQGNDTIYGGDGDDHFYLASMSGTDTIDGGNGHDQITFVSSGDISITATNLTDASYSQAGGDASGDFRNVEEVNLASGNDTVDLTASNQNMTVSGGAGDDSLTGGSGSDRFFGGDGNDRLDGGAGDDTLSGGSGDDTFAFREHSGQDVVTDFDIGDSDGDGRLNDQLDVSGLQNPDGSPVTVSDVTVQDDGSGNARLLFPEGESVVLQGVSPAFMSDPANMRAAGIPCFTPGAMIATERGARRIEDLRVGDRVFTRDHGLQPIRWIGRRTVVAEGRFAPILIQPKVIHGLDAPLLVSPQHRMLFQGYRAELLFGESEVLVTARHLVDGIDVVRQSGGQVTYLHLMFDQHEVIFANGAATESFHPGQEAISGVDAQARDELFSIFPELRSDPAQFGPTARLCLRQFECDLLRG